MTSSKVTAGPVRKSVRKPGIPKTTVLGNVSTKTAVTVDLKRDQSGAQMVVPESLPFLCPFLLVYLYCCFVVSVVSVSVTKHR